MKYIIYIILLFSGSVFSQNIDTSFNPDSLFTGSVNFSNGVIINGDTSNVDLNSFINQLSYDYTLDKVSSGDVLVDATGTFYEVVTVNSSNIFAANLNVVRRFRTGSNFPFLSGLISKTRNKQIAIPATNNLGITTKLQSEILIYNTWVTSGSVDDINEVILSDIPPLNPAIVKMWVDTTDVDSIYFNNNGVWNLFEVAVSENKIIEDITGFTPQLFMPVSEDNTGDFSPADTSNLASYLIVEIISPTRVVLSSQGIYDVDTSIISRGVYFTGDIAGVLTTSKFEQKKQYLGQVTRNGKFDIDVQDLVIVEQNSTTQDIVFKDILSDTVNLSFSVVVGQPVSVDNSFQYQLADTSTLASLVVIEILGTGEAVLSHVNNFETTLGNGLYYTPAIAGVATQTQFVENRQFLFEVINGKGKLNIGNEVGVSSTPIGAQTLSETLINGNDATGQGIVNVGTIIPSAGSNLGSTTNPFDSAFISNNSLFFMDGLAIVGHLRSSGDTLYYDDIPFATSNGSKGAIGADVGAFDDASIQADLSAKDDTLFSHNIRLLALETEIPIVTELEKWEIRGALIDFDSDGTASGSVLPIGSIISAGLITYKENNQDLLRSGDTITIKQNGEYLIKTKGQHPQDNLSGSNGQNEHGDFSLGYILNGVSTILDTDSDSNGGNEAYAGDDELVELFIGDEIQFFIIDSGNARSSEDYYVSFSVIQQSTSSTILPNTVLVTEGQAITSIKGTTTDPIKGTTDIDVISWQKIGGYLNVDIHFNQTTGGVIGGGDYYFEIPAGFTVDNTRLPSASGGSYLHPTIGSGMYHELGFIRDDVIAIYLNGGISFIRSDNEGIFGQANDRADLNEANTHISINCRIPVTQ